MIRFVEIIFLIKAEMSEKDFEGKKQMPQVATTLTKDVLLSVVGKKEPNYIGSGLVCHFGRDKVVLSKTVFIEFLPKTG